MFLADLTPEDAALAEQDQRVVVSPQPPLPAEIHEQLGSTELEDQLLGIPLNRASLNRSRRLSNCEELVKNDSKILELAHKSIEDVNEFV